MNGEHRIIVVQSVQNKSRQETGSDLVARNGSHFLQSPNVRERDAGHFDDVLPSVLR